MSASPVVLTQKAIYENADTNVHKADSLRRVTDQLVGVGVLDLNSFRVRQRVAGAAGSVDVTDAATVSKAFVRGSSTTEQGTYLVHNVAPSTGTIDAIYNVDIAVGDATNPRIDQVYLCVEDAQHAGSNNQATIRVVAGTATGGATLDNRTGVGAAPAGMSSILLADILQPATNTNVLTANIRDRRPVGNIGTVPWLGAVGTQADIVQFVPASGLQLNGAAVAASSAGYVQQGVHDNMQAAALMWLPRRIVGATRIRWRYQQGTTANAAGVALFICDASGRQILTSSTTFTGAANQTVEAAFVIGAQTFEAGWYYVGIGFAALTAASVVYYSGVVTGVATLGNTVGPAYRNLAFRSTTGGTTAPTTLAAFTDCASLAGATAAPMVPIPALSVG